MKFNKVLYTGFRFMSGTIETVQEIFTSGEIFMQVPSFLHIGILISFGIFISALSEEKPAMYLCVDSMMQVKKETGEDPQKLVYGYINGRKTPCMSEYELRVKLSEKRLDEKGASPEKVKKPLRQLVYRGEKKLANADLRGLDLQGLDLSGADLRNAVLESADLRGANLRNANLTGANLENAYCKNVNLEGANVTDAKLRGAYFHFAHLKNVEGLTVENLCTVTSVYKACLEAPVLEIIETSYPAKLRNPKGSWKQKIYTEMQQPEPIPLSEQANPEDFH
jgi:hypothetical protein